MKKIKGLLLTCAILGTGFSAVSCTINRPEEPKRTITVSGTGAVSVKPDLVSLKFLVRTTGWNVNQAAEKNAVNTNNVLTAIKAAGVAESDISTSDYRISQDNSKDFPGQYTVTNTVAVLIRNTDITGSVIDAAVKQNTGANGITSFEYLVSDKTSALRQARTLAIQDAQDAANLLAGASGCKVSNVMEILENYTSSQRSNGLMKAAAYDDAVTTPITPGSIDVTSNVTVRYTIE